jgi:hypothetical protein
MSRQPDEIADDDFAAQAKRRFDESVERIDGATQSKLTRARHAALAKAGSARPGWYQWVPAAGVAAAAAVAVVIWTGNPAIEGTGSPEVADIEILLTEDSLEMLEDLEFYSWIDLESGSESRPVPENNVG